MLTFKKTLCHPIGLGFASQDFFFVVVVFCLVGLWRLLSDIHRAVTGSNETCSTLGIVYDGNFTN